MRLKPDFMDSLARPQENAVRNKANIAYTPRQPRLVVVVDNVAALK